MRCGSLFSSFPGGRAGTPLNIVDNQRSVASGPPTILASLLPTQAEASPPREDICNDGIEMITME